MERPLVSILLPVTGNAMYIEIALLSVLLQTYTNIEIIIRDATPTNQVQHVLEKEFLPYYDKITYIKDFHYLSPLNILQELLRHAKGTYINFLREQDVLYPTKIESMMHYFLQDEASSIKLVISNKESIDTHGNIHPASHNIHQVNTQWNSTDSIDFILQHPTYLQGLSLPLFKKQDLQKKIGVFADHPFVEEIELASWLHLASQGDSMFLTEKLTFERILDTDKHPKITFHRITDWMYILKLLKIKNHNLHHNTEENIIKRTSEWIVNTFKQKQYILTPIEREKLYQYKEELDILSTIT